MTARATKQTVITDKNFYQVGELLILDIRKFGGTTQLTEDQLDERFGEDKDVLRGIQDLLLPADQDYLRALQVIRNEVHSYIYRNSIPSDIPLFYFIRKSMKQSVEEYLEGAKERFKELAVEFADRWDEIEKRFAKEKPNLYRPDKYPTKASLLSRFVFNWKFKQINPADETSDELKLEVNRMKQWVLRAMKKTISERMEVLAKSCSDGKINTATLNSINTQIFEKYETLFAGFIDSTDMKQAIGDLQEYLDGTDAEMLREDDSFRKMVEDKAREVASTIEKIKEAKDDRALIF